MAALIQTRSLQVVMRCLDRLREEGADISITTTEPDSVVMAGTHTQRIDRDTSEGSWEDGNGHQQGQQRQWQHGC